MLPEPVHAVALACHPETPTAAVRGIAARVYPMVGGELKVCYVLEGNRDRLRVPPPRARRMTSGLWRHTCCEAFIGCKGSPGYYEFNFSPSGEWAAYAFDGYRTPAARDRVSTEPPPQVTVRSTADTLGLDAVILSPLRTPGNRITLALSVVVEDNSGALSYWALRHPAGQPDFHHPAGFVLELQTEAA